MKPFTLYVFFNLAFILAFGCSSSRPREISVTPLPAPQITYAATVTISAVTVKPLQPHDRMGEGLYSQPSANSCLFCHGADGKGGRVSGAGDLTRPSTWKVYRAIGGTAAYQQNGVEFVARMKLATTALIQDGATLHNARFRTAWFNWNAPGMSPYNSQMLGLHGAPSQEWLERFSDIGMTPAIAAEGAVLYLSTLDAEGILAPKPSGK